MIRTISVWILIISVLLLCACSGTSATKTVQHTPYQVDITVWAVLGPNESIGDTTNNGCRLSEDDMTTLINQLQQNASVFATNTKFVWDEVINEVHIAALNNSNRTILLQSFVNQVLFQPDPPYWTENTVNIYFTGNTLGGGSFEVIGLAEDPADLLTTGDPIPTPFILINDGGFNTFGGSDILLHQLRFTMEHEMCHYIARFRHFAGNTPIGRTVGTGPSARIYDSTEHTTSYGNLLYPDPEVVGERSLSIPGKEAPAGSVEKGEVSTRVRNGTWDVP